MDARKIPRDVGSGGLLVGELEKKYRRDLRQLPQKPGSLPWKMAKRKLWEQLQANRLQRDADPRIVHHFQELFASEYYDLVKSFYEGALQEQEYRGERRQALRRYAERLFSVGLVSGVFPPEWITDFAQSSLALERSIAPPQDRTWSQEKAEALCIPLRDFSKQFFRSIHAEFGVGRLGAGMKGTCGGVDPKRKDLELGLE